MFKNFDDFQKFGKQQFDAATVSASTWSKGIQQIATEASDYSKKSFEASQGLFEKLVGAKSVDKVIELQTEYAKNAYESFVAQTTKMGEICTGLAKEAFKPVEEAMAKAQTVTH
jgi:hypothetical protein